VDGDALNKLREDLLEQISLGATQLGFIGSDPDGLELLAWIRGQAPAIEARWYGGGPTASSSGVAAPLDALAEDRPSVVAVMADGDKEAVIREALPHLSHAPKLLVAGYRHYDFRDDLFEATAADLLVPSIANGYPNTLVHLYQCLVNAARLNLEGSVVEFGVFKGGTTMFLAKIVAALDRKWPVVGFDTFGGFPARKSALDMYDHPGAEFRDFDAVRDYLASADVELIQGDIAETAAVLGDRPVVLAFVDTDNFSSARAAVAAVRNTVVPGGAIVFDHLTGVDRFRYTLGERMAAAELFEDERYFNLHASGVFLRQH
jgi:hypothetical protein